MVVPWVSHRLTTARIDPGTHRTKRKCICRGTGGCPASPCSLYPKPKCRNREGCEIYLSPDAIKWLYTDGAEDHSKISPDSYTMDQSYITRTGNDEIQLALFRNYGTKIPLYETWQSYLRSHQPPTLVISGKKDAIFIAAGAEAFKKDIQDAQVNLLNGGHFVFEEKHTEAATVIKSFLSKKGIR